jgi:hypothetical protein
VSWSYLGNEANDVNTFSAPGIAPYVGNNANNDCGTCALPLPAPSSPQIGIQFMGTSVSTNTTVPFTLTDTTTGASVSNGTGNSSPGTQINNLVFSYATFSGGVYSLTSTPTIYVVFGYNDNGGADDNHDDFMGVATLLTTGSGDPTTPLPAALPLFGSVLGGWIAFPPVAESSSGRSQRCRRLVNLDKVQYQKGPLKRPLFLYYINGNQIRAGFTRGPLVAASRILIVTIFRSVHQGTPR